MKVRSVQEKLVSCGRQPTDEGENQSSRFDHHSSSAAAILGLSHVAIFYQSGLADENMINKLQTFKEISYSMHSKWGLI